MDDFQGWNGLTARNIRAMLKFVRFIEPKYFSEGRANAFKSEFLVLQEDTWYLLWNA